jgi:hypothetical protein
MVLVDFTIVQVALPSIGTGLGFCYMINIAALTGTRRGEEGFSSGLINTSRLIGGR